MPKFYSRLARVEERKSIRNTIVFSILTVAIIILFVFFGLPIFAKFAGVFVNLKKSNQAIDIADTTPPGPPFINAIPEATNNQALDITGTTEAASTVTLYLNTVKDEVVAGNDGNFVFRVSLNTGQNTIYAITRDKSGNQSQKSQVYNIVYTNKPPKLTVDSPSDGSQFYGTKQQQIQIKGFSDVGVSLTINDRLVRVNDDGSFSFDTSLSSGDNTFKFKAQDDAGNTTEKSLTLHFSSY